MGTSVEPHTCTALDANKPKVKGRIITTIQKAKEVRPLVERCVTIAIRANDGSELVFTYDTQAERTGVTTLMGDLNRAGIGFRDLETKQSSLEDIFVGLVSDRP